MKPLKGHISNWCKKPVPQDFPETFMKQRHLGYQIHGRPGGHPVFSNWILTSLVVKHNEETGELETLNSRYQLIGSELTS